MSAHNPLRPAKAREMFKSLRKNMAKLDADLAEAYARMHARQAIEHKPANMKFEYVDKYFSDFEAGFREFYPEVTANEEVYFDKAKDELSRGRKWGEGK